MDGPADSSGYGLLVSFPDQSESFVLGFEAGSLWEKIESGNVAEIEATTHVENREVIQRMAMARGWSVEVKASAVAGWDFTRLEKQKPAPERPNPHGLRVVT